MGIAEVAAIIVELLKLGVLALGEYFEQKKAARLANEKYEADKARIQEIFAQCLERMKTKSKTEADRAQDVEDQIDKEIKK